VHLVQPDQSQQVLVYTPLESPIESPFPI
jgi:hypothetical protein